MPFRPGDHLQVSRALYHHHGIYVGDERVVQFGGSVWDKPRAKIEEVPLDTFSRGGKVQVVDHEGLTWLGLWELPPPLPPDRIVARARCLASQPATYNLVGRNCETVALWCVCNIGESLQRQRFQAVNAAIAGPTVVYFSWLNGREHLTPRQQRHMRMILVTVVIRAWLLVVYYRHNHRFYVDARACSHL